jgi:hypothetical protein
MNNTNSVIPDISTKIKELTATKQVYLKFIIQLFPLLKNQVLCDYANELVILLQNLINIHKNEILFELEDGLTSALVTYIHDIVDIIEGHLDLNKYESRHNNLVAINQQIDYNMKTNDLYNLTKLKMNLFLID